MCRMINDTTYTACKLILIIFFSMPNTIVLYALFLTLSLLNLFVIINIFYLKKKNKIIFVTCFDSLFRFPSFPTKKWKKAQNNIFTPY